MADEKPIIPFSRLVGDDGGIARAKKEIEDFESFVVSKSNKLKGSLSVIDTKDTKAISELAKEVDTLKKMKKEAENATKSLIKSEKILNDQIKESIRQEVLLEKAKQEKLNTVKKEIQADAQLNRAIVSENNLKKSQISLSEAERKQREAAEKVTLRQKDAYGQLSAELNKLFRASANVAAEMFILERAGQKATPQYEALEQEFNQLAKQTTHLDQNLKKIDATLGRNQRNVGNYASGFNGLQNSINQITREFPAFTFSAQTGFLALSNNIPILVDEINNIKQKNNELLAQGKPITGMATQITRSILSWGTAISLLITGLTIFAPKMIAWISSMFQGAKAVDTQKTALEELINKTTQYNDKASTLAEQEITRANRLFITAKNKTASDNERRKAVEELQKRYPAYLGNLKDEEILTGNVAKAQNELIRALKLRALALAAQDMIAENLKKQLKLEIESSDIVNKTAESQKLYDVAQQGVLKTKRKLRAMTEEELNSTEALEQAQKNSSEVVFKNGKKITTQMLNAQNIRINGLIPLTKEADLLDAIFKKYMRYLGVVVEGEDEKKKRIQQINNVDFLASDFEFQRTRLSNNIAANEEIFASDEYLLERRLQAQKDLVKESLELAELERKEAIRVLTKKYEEEKNETIKDGNGKVLAKKYTQNGLKELEKQFDFDLMTIQEKFYEDERNAQKKADKLSLIDMLEMQINELKFRQKFLSKKSEMYKQYNKEISLLQHEIDEIVNKDEILNTADRLKISEGELKRLQELNKKIAEENKIKSPLSFLTGGQYKRSLKIIEDFEKEKTRLERNEEIKRQQNRIAAIDEELENYGKGTIKYNTLMEERNKIQSDLEKKKTEDTLNRQKEVFEKWKQFTEDLNQLIGNVLDKVLEVTQKRVEQENILLKNQKNSVETQQRRAEQGLDNTLAYEQQALAKREAELQKQQRREERLQKIKSIWTSYSGYVQSEKEPGMALIKTLRDFAVLEAITASFGDGGLIEDKVPTDGRGIIRGRSHKGQGGGIPVLVEGNEGILSGREIKNLGKENFYALKTMLGRGKVSADLFTNQKEDFINSMPVFMDNSNLERGLQEIKDEIRNKEVSKVEFKGIVNGILELMETQKRGNMVTRNTHRFKF